MTHAHGHRSSSSAYLSMAMTVALSSAVACATGVEPTTRADDTSGAAGRGAGATAGAAGASGPAGSGGTAVAGSSGASGSRIDADASRDAAGGGGGSGGAGTGAGAGGSVSSAGGSGGGAGRDGGASGTAGQGSGAAGAASSAEAFGVGPDSGAPAGSLFYDTFEDGNRTQPSWVDADPTLNGMWTVTATAGNNVLVQSAVVSDWIMAVAGSYRWTDQVVEAKVRFTSAPGMVGVFARVQDLRNYYFLYLDGTNIILRKRVNNSSTTLVKVKLATPTAVGEWHVLKLSAVGAGLTGYLDGNVLVPLTSSVGDGGAAADVRAGGIAVGASDASAEFDDVIVKPL